MANVSPAQIVIFFTISLLFTSLVTSWILLQAYGVTIAGLPIELLSGNTQTDFTSGANTQGSKEISGNWVYSSGIGRTADSADSYFVFNKLKANNEGKYINSYVVNNSNKKDYSIIVSYSWQRTQEVIVSQDGFHLIEHTTGLSNLVGDREIYFYPYPNANQETNPNIKTVYNLGGVLNPNNQETTFDYYLDNNLLFSAPSDSLWGAQMEGLVDVYYGGIGSKNNAGLTIEKFSSDSSSTSTSVTDLIAYMTTLLKLLTWGIDAKYLPYEMNILLIKSQEFALGVGILGIFWK